MKFYSIAPDILKCKDEIGNKARNLAHVTQLLGREAVARGFVLPANYLETENQGMIALEIIEECRKQNLYFPVILRSSANVEDSRCSFAGIFESYICDGLDDILMGLKVVHGAMQSERLREYCKKMNININSVRLAIIVQQVVDAEYSGVAFSKHPITNNPDVILVEYLYGNTNGVESGSVDPMEVCIKKGLTETEKVNTGLNYFELANIVTRLEVYLKKPIDVEWAFGSLGWIIFQVRPITTG